MAKMRGADIIAEYLVKEKVPYLFGLCGHGDIGFLDAFYDRQDKIKALTVRHEQAAGHMADAYFRVAHKPVATFTSCGPGSTNLLTALASAMMDSSAFLAITGDVPTSQFGRSPFQETGRHYQAEFPNVIRPYVKKSFQPTRVEMIPLMIRQAFKTMLTGRTGPVNIDIPLNCFAEEADVEIPEPELWRGGISSRGAGNPELLEKVLELLLSTDKPCIIAGHGAVLSEVAPELRRLVDLLNLPVATTANGKGIIPADHPLSLGVVGRNGSYMANEACRSCDVLLALGVKFDDRQSSAWIPGYTFNIPPTKLIHVEIDPDEMARNYPPTLGILGDAKAFLKELLKLAETKVKKDKKRNKAWLDEIQNWRKGWEEFNRPNLNSTVVPIRPERLVRDIREVMPRDAILISDVGEHHNWLLQFYDVYEPGGMLQSWGFASMGFGVCGVLGAKLAAPGKVCVSVCGDGGFMMTPHILCTAVEYDIPAVWIVWNNYGWNVIRHQANGAWPGREIVTSFKRDETGEFYNPDFAALAKACGADGAKVGKPGDFKEVFHQAIKSNKPFVIDVVVDRNAKAPSTGTWVLPPFTHGEPSYGKRNLRK
ncbi:MAG: thiamine pyrophosphate-binding protein [Desulfobacterales bacterium]|jgi:acetolactate synthase-1/2/3 large subunit|nr:thiamine pyrophosphate-binding protein [Desulfobacterales bacterium]